MPLANPLILSVADPFIPVEVSYQNPIQGGVVFLVRHLLLSEASGISRLLGSRLISGFDHRLNRQGFGTLGTPRFSILGVICHSSIL